MGRMHLCLSKKVCSFDFSKRILCKMPIERPYHHFDHNQADCHLDLCMRRDMLLYSRLEMYSTGRVKTEMKIEEKQTRVIVGGTTILLKRFRLTKLWCMHIMKTETWCRSWLNRFRTTIRQIFWIVHWQISYFIHNAYFTGKETEKWQMKMIFINVTLPHSTCCIMRMRIGTKNAFVNKNLFMMGSCLFVFDNNIFRWSNPRDKQWRMMILLIYLNLHI